MRNIGFPCEGWGAVKGSPREIKRIKFPLMVFQNRFEVCLVIATICNFFKFDSIIRVALYQYYTKSRIICKKTLFSAALICRNLRLPCCHSQWQKTIHPHLNPLPSRERKKGKEHMPPYSRERWKYRWAGNLIRKDKCSRNF